jgi:hypothetical protein
LPSLPAASEKQFESGLLLATTFILIGPEQERTIANPDDSRDRQFEERRNNLPWVLFICAID